MDLELIVIAAIFTVTVLSAVVIFAIRKAGKDKGIETADLEQGVQQGKDVAINQLNKLKEKQLGI